MLFRHHPPPTTVAERFGEPGSWFTSQREGDVHVTRVACALDRAVDLLQALSAHLPPVVDLSLECVRSGRRFVGEGLSLTEVREAIARLKVPLVASGGVELTVYTADDQLALSPMLDLWLYSRTDRWVYLLVAEEVEEAVELPRRDWAVRRDEFTGAPELVEAVEKTAERLTLRLV